MRNAVIRKKLIKERATIRRFFLHPQRIILGAMPNVDVDWASANYHHNRLGAWSTGR